MINDYKSYTLKEFLHTNKTPNSGNYYYNFYRNWKPEILISIPIKKNEQSILYNWCKNNCKYKFRHTLVGFLDFENKIDAVLFLLTWKNNNYVLL